MLIQAPQLHSGASSISSPPWQPLPAPPAGNLGSIKMPGFRATPEAYHPPTSIVQSPHQPHRGLPQSFNTHLSAPHELCPDPSTLIHPRQCLTAPKPSLSASPSAALLQQHHAHMPSHHMTHMISGPMGMTHVNMPWGQPGPSVQSAPEGWAPAAPCHPQMGTHSVSADSVGALSVGARSAGNPAAGYPQGASYTSGNTVPTSFGSSDQVHLRNPPVVQPAWMGQQQESSFHRRDGDFTGAEESWRRENAELPGASKRLPDRAVEDLVGTLPGICIRT